MSVSDILSTTFELEMREPLINIDISPDDEIPKKDSSTNQRKKYWDWRMKSCYFEDVNGGIHGHCGLLCELQILLISKRDKELMCCTPAVEQRDSGRARAKRTTAATKRVGGEWRTREGTKN
jgi:hypothetical protein